MKRILHLNLAQAIKLMLITLMCLPVWSTAVKAQSPEAYAVFDSTTGTLTFKYDAAKPEGAYETNEDYAVPGWYDVVNDIKKIVFEPSFADARPTSCHYWFSNYRGEEIEGLEYLNTSEVTNMVYMFSSCYSLKKLDVSKFNTGKVTNFKGSPDISRGKLFDSIENLYLCAMNNQGLLALAQLILPSEILTNFEVVRVEEEASLIRIYLDESVKVEYKENPEIESKGFCEAVTIRDFPIRDKGVDLIVRRRKWYDKQNNRYFSDSYELKAEGTRYSKEFAAFLKGVYGDDSYDLPFA